MMYSCAVCVKSKSKDASGNEIFLDLKEFETFCEWAHSTSLKKKNMPQVEMVVNNVTQ